jgi:small subunit ribosomal protein S20
LAAAERRRVHMANIRSQEKRNHRSERERLENRRRTSTVKTYFHRLERAIESNDRDAVEAEYRALVSKIDKAAEHGALHSNNAARKKSRAARLRARLTA